MLKTAVAIAVPAFGMAWVLSQTDVAQRARVASRPAVAASQPTPRAITPYAPASPRTSADSFAIDPDRAGQFQTTMEIAGRSLPALVDTGAFAVFLTFEDAAGLGYHPVANDFQWRIRTANGETKAAPVTIPMIRVGNVEARNVQAVISQPGALTTHNLLGMTFLRKLSGYQVDAGRMVLKQ